MPQLYFTDMAILQMPVIIDGMIQELTAAEIAEAANLGLSDGVPFILADDGSYDHDLNRFFRACPTMGVRSLNSLRAYARDIVVWLRFLVERRDNKSVWAADRDDIAAFHKARRMSEPPHRISASSWNRSITALDKLYGWAVEENLIDKTPFTYKQVWVRPVGNGPVSMPVNVAREPAARKRNTKFLSLERYLLFRDVGLRGRLPDGRDDPSWCGRNGERNALFAELLVTTGLRLQEGASLLLLELPSSEHQEQRSIPFTLASATAKGSKAREIRLPLRLIEQLRDYGEVERLNALNRYQQRRAWKPIERPLIVMGHDHRSLRLDDSRCSRSVGFGGIKPSERSRLVHRRSMEPLALWLTEGGLPMSSAAWQAVFSKASARCRSFGLDIDVTPHMLRHTFAVHMLTLLLREQINWLLHGQSGGLSPAYRRLVGDPLLKLQRLMGHSSIESTNIYLEHLDECQELLDAAVNQWGLDVSFVGDAS